MKKFLIYLSLIILTISFADTGYAESRTEKQEATKPSLSNGEFSYTIKEDGIYINGILSDSVNINPPPMIDDIPVAGIENGAFYNNRTIEKVVLSENIKVIGDNAFEGASSLTEIYLSDSLTEIGAGAFSECTALTHINIPASVNNIGANAFDRSAKLIEINVHPDNKSYSSKEGVLFDKSGAILIKYPPSRQNSFYKIPSDVIVISPYAFNYAYLLEEVSVPEKLEIAGELAFGSCSSLRELYFPESLKGVGKNAFFGCTGLKKLTFLSDPIGLNNELYSDVNPIVEGVIGSAAEVFAENNNFTFIPYENNKEDDKNKPEFITKTLPPALRYFPYSAKIELFDEKGEIYLKDGSELPRGLYLSDGIIMGRAEGWGVYRFTLFANNDGMETEQSFTLNINKEPLSNINAYPVKKNFPEKVYINSLDKKDITVSSNEDYIISVYIDSDELSKSDYEHLNETVTLNNDVLNNLSEGGHLLVIEYSKGSVAAPFQVKNTVIPLEDSETTPTEDTEKAIIGKADDKTVILVKSESTEETKTAALNDNEEEEISENPNTGNTKYPFFLLPASVILIFITKLGKRKAKNK